jgi:hypothetical protein
VVAISVEMGACVCVYMWLIEIGFRWVWLGVGCGGGGTDTHIYSSNCVGQWDLVETEGCGEVKQNWFSKNQRSLSRNRKNIEIEHFRLGIMFCMVASRHGSHCFIFFFAICHRSQIHECGNWETEHYKSVLKNNEAGRSFIAGNTLIETRHLYQILTGPSFAV